MTENNNNAKHDEFFKKVMEKAYMREFLEHYLPGELKREVDLSTATLEKESYVDQSLRKMFSDIVISILNKAGEKIYTYALVEHQSGNDDMIAWRLEKYKLALLERHTTSDGKFPLVHGVVVYNGLEPYKAPRSFWDLFEEPEKARELYGTYTLVDFRSMSDEDIINKGHSGMPEYAMKYIHEKDLSDVLDKLFSNFKNILPADKKLDYVYTNLLFWYIDSKAPIEDKDKIDKVAKKYLNNKEGEEVMGTIAQAYIDEGREKGREEGIEKGRQKEKIALAKSMLKKQMDIELIVELTGLSKDKIRKLKK